MSHCLQELKNIIVKQLGIEHSVLDASASLEELGIDSLAVAEILFTVEEHFSISLGNVQAEQLTSLSSIAEVIEQAMMKEAA